MKKSILLLIALAALSAACGRAAAPAANAEITATPSVTTAPSLTPLPSATPSPSPIPPTPTPSASPTPSYPTLGRGPTNFAQNVDPLTGLEVEDVNLLTRRPLVIKVENIPRAHRPQWGLSVADLVYEYYTEMGATRFAAVFYGADAERVGPIRSGRFFDSNVVQMYKGVFVYGSAYPPVQSRFFNSDFSNRLILETSQSCPALCRYDPNGENLLVANTGAMKDYLVTRSVDNTRQNLDGMFFKLEAPTGGKDASKVFVRYSGAIYNRWDYDPATGRYLRFADKQDDVNRNNEVYEQLTDRLTGEPIGAENVVTLCAPHQYFVLTAESEVLDIIMNPNTASYVGCDGNTYPGGTGAAYIARDGKMYPVTWKRTAIDSALTLLDDLGNPFAFKPGQTWFEVIGASSTVDSQEQSSWRFTHKMAP